MTTTSPENPDIRYLKEDNIGKVLSKGLAVLYREQPQFPVEYFAKWLLNYSSSIQNEKNHADVLKHKADLIEKALKEKAEEDKRQAEIQQKKNAILQADEDFRTKIREHKYLNELLTEEFPDYLCFRKRLTGVYVGSLDFPTKDIDEMDEDENAHLDQTQRLITFIGNSKNHQFMKNKRLTLEQGVTNEVFKPPQEVDGEMKPAPEFFYVKNVVNEPRMVFFRIPKLGAFMSIALIWSSCLSEAAFDAGVEERIRFRKAKSEQEKDMEARETKFQTDLIEKQEAKEPTEELEAEYDNWKKALEPVQEAAFQTIRKEFVVNCDTMGQDREINQNDQNFLNDFVKLFAKSWEDTEHEELSKDIDFQLEYLESLGQTPAKEIAENFNAEEEKYAEERRIELEEFKEKEKELNYHLDCFKLEKLCQVLGAKEVKDWVFHLTKYRVVKYLSVFQAIWYLLGYTKEDLNTPGTTVLNWKNAKNWIKEEFFTEVLNFDHRGAKPKEVKNYAKILHLIKKIEKLNPEDIDNYNLGLGRLFRWLSMSLRLRKLNIEIRKENFEKKVNDRFNKIDENEKIKAAREQALDDHKATIPPEEVEAFDPEEWLRVYNEEHPMMEIPEEPVEDVDNDLEVE